MSVCFRVVYTKRLTHLSVIPANAGIHFDFALGAHAKIKMDPSVRWDDGKNAVLNLPNATACERYCMECRPNMLPSVSNASAMNPYSPMDIFSRWIRPPAAATRPASTAQSAQLK